MSAQPIDEIPDWTLGERLRKIRRHRGLSQEKMAELLDVGLRAYSGWEADIHSPRSGQLVQIARTIEDRTGFPADWVLGLRTGSFTGAHPGMYLDHRDLTSLGLHLVGALAD